MVRFDLRLSDTGLLCYIGKLDRQWKVTAHLLTLKNCSQTAPLCLDSFIGWGDL